MNVFCDSLQNIKNALDYEESRQKKPGQLAKQQETRMFDEKKRITIKMRSKEQAEDYRFISDPDLPVVKLNSNRIAKLKKELLRPLKKN